MNRLNLVTLGVKNLSKSIEFYLEILGFDVYSYGEEGSPSVAFFNNEGTKISLYPLEGLVKDINEVTPPSMQTGFSGITFAYNAKSEEEVDDIFKHLQSHSVTISKLPQKVFWGGYSGYFQDPDGYYWEVAYGESWEFDEQNMLVIKPNE
ncbi:VOC family protein [Solibacillus sp. FSL H8-0538]|uniref:VOC family protein n=1 Tax=Solibacillus sp. FSL H8-0538 TaxID=2921400 RepID=UPI0030FA6DDB